MRAQAHPHITSDAAAGSASAAEAFSGAAPVAFPVAFSDRYWLTELIAVGGMAEIYRARQAAMAGFEKDVVIKRLRPELVNDTRIVEMFLDEARIGAVLGHPNIVHVYDVEQHQGIPYIAMEHIRGQELSGLCRRSLGLGNFLPLGHAIELVRQAAEGMGYFHAKRDHTGTPLEIVHCDISPSNLLVTEDGFLKIIDFGIARAKNQRFRDDRIIPGKLSYMAPEQVAGDAIDHRADIFSLGIVLYEITVGRRLFKGPAAEVAERLLAADITPPTFVRNDFPGRLEAIILRALERHPDDRYQSAYELAEDLQSFLYEAGLTSGPVHIARYLDELALAEGGFVRPELATRHADYGDAVAHERPGDDDEDDDLGFDRGMFDEFVPAAPERPGFSGVGDEWDDCSQDDADIAAALGMELEAYYQARDQQAGQNSPRAGTEGRRARPWARR